METWQWCSMMGERNTFTPLIIIDFRRCCSSLILDHWATAVWTHFCGHVVSTTSRRSTRRTAKHRTVWSSHQNGTYYFLFAFTCFLIAKWAGVGADDRRLLYHMVVGFEPPEYRPSPASFKPLSCPAFNMIGDRVNTLNGDRIHFTFIYTLLLLPFLKKNWVGLRRLGMSNMCNFHYFFKRKVILKIPIWT